MRVQTLARGRFADFDCEDLTVRSVVWVCEGLTSLRAVVACACCGLTSCTRHSARKAWQAVLGRSMHSGQRSTVLPRLHV